ncbi:MAG: hypothetical protein RL293_1413, partial [Bacteroidota bacterium]
MENKKYEQLIDLIINENEEQARELFHDIVVEKSREIYESMMYEEHGPKVTDMLDEIGMEETSGMVEDEESDDEENIPDLEINMHWYDLAKEDKKDDEKKPNRRPNRRTVQSE